uniref:Uncharacterized protein n=1 Tax=Helicotheca tamesis TaxID=374047 RepID=A0A7S2E5W6_9STRA|mmetsp:Transcript_12343/g.17019  ORF Transcript_12343/g.17019 Transcript_12343/m.17019 type:complete len:205 (+) Transcript_12343:144-758(+)
MMNYHLLLLSTLLVFISQTTTCFGFALWTSSSSAANHLHDKKISMEKTHRLHQIVQMRSRRSVNNAFCVRPMTPTETTTTTTTLYAQKDDNDTPNDNSNNTNKEPSTQNKPLSDAFDTILLLFSYCTQFFGAAVSVGLLLNLCGYGYTFDFKEGLYVDKIENIRKEVQFRREILRSAKESSGSSKVQKTLPGGVEESLSPLLPR